MTAVRKPITQNLSVMYQWLGCEADSLINDNVGEDKWYARSYKEAQKNIKISREYFDKCYNEPYVKHFYSDEDIEKMKKRWEKNIYDK